MSDVLDAGGAAAPAESPSTPSVPITHDHAPDVKPLGSQTPVAEKPDAPAEPKSEPKPEKKELPSARDAVRQAHDKLKVEQGKKDDAEARPRDEKTGQFTPTNPQPKEAAPKADAQPPEPSAEPQRPDAQSQPPASRETPPSDAPARFSPDAKANWATTHESVRGEVNRAISELTNGYEKHKEASQAYEPLRRYDELAKQHGTNIPAALERYMAFERSLRADPINGLRMVASDMGFSLDEIASKIVGQSPDESRAQYEQENGALRRHVTQLETALREAQSHFERQQAESAMSAVEAFAQDHPRFDELADDIAWLMSTGRTKDLAKAYEMADRLNPAASPQPAPAPASSAAQQPPPLSPAANRSVSGAPTPGSSPARSGPIPSTREAVKRAMELHGRA